jgi:hypothetical protein
VVKLEPHGVREDLSVLLSQHLVLRAGWVHLCRWMFRRGFSGRLCVGIITARVEESVTVCEMQRLVGVCRWDSRRKVTVEIHVSCYLEELRHHRLFSMCPSRRLFIVETMIGTARISVHGAPGAARNAEHSARLARNDLVVSVVAGQELCLCSIENVAYRSERRVPRRTGTSTSGATEPERFG